MIIDITICVDEMHAAGSSFTDVVHNKNGSIFIERTNKSPRRSLIKCSRRNSRFEALTNDKCFSRDPSLTSSNFYKKTADNNKYCIYLQCIYEKSRAHNLVPVLILVAYSFLGGIIFYSLESTNEEILVKEKKEYIEQEKHLIANIITDIEEIVHRFREEHKNTYLINPRLRRYKKFALNRLRARIYWFTLSSYYLMDQETYKALLLNPQNPEPIWQMHFTSSFNRLSALKNYTEQLSIRCWEISLEFNHDRAEAYHKLENALSLFYSWTGLTQVLTPTWNFWNSMYFAVTTYTTIGYGNIAAKSKLGRLAAMLYAVIGIPLALMVLHKLGRQFQSMLEYSWDYFMRAIEFFTRMKETTTEKPLGGQSRDGKVPILLAVGVAFGWMFLCAAVFLRFEKDWDYFTGFYFFFCSLTTIGYGDVTPTNNEDIFVIFGFIIVGLSLVSMCINVVQLKYEQLFEELLIMLLEEYKEIGEQTIDIKEKMGLTEMWRMWRKKKRQCEPKESLKTRSIMSLKRRREALVQQIRRSLNAVSRGTQTDTPGFCDKNIQSFETSYLRAHIHSLPLNERSSMTNNYDIRKVLCREIRNEFASPIQFVTTATSSDSSGFVSAEKKSFGHTSSIDSLGSSIYGTQSDFTAERNTKPRWCFNETVKSRRGTPRGLIGPVTHMKTYAKQVHTTDLEGLFAEIDARLSACHAIAAPSSLPSTTSTSFSSKENLLRPFNR